MTIQKISIVLGHAFIGWALCGVTMGIGLATMSLESALLRPFGFLKPERSSI